MDYTKQIGEKIAALRTEREMTINELAENTGLSTEQIKRAAMPYTSS